MPKYFSIFLILLPVCLVSQNNMADLLDRNKPNHHEVSLVSNGVNTDFPDFAPFKYASKLYFSSTQQDNASGEKAVRVFTTNGNSAPVLFEKNPTDWRVNMANVSISLTGQRMYYTLFKTDEEGAVTKSEIWYRDKNYQGRWTAPILLPSSFELRGHIATQPATGVLREVRKQVLFFVSDRPGGKGKLDIWASYELGGGKFSEPFNLPINTPEDDVSPFFDNVNQTLFFSSKGHLSLGGFDVLRSRLLPGGKWSVPGNLGRPINSYYDDLYFTLVGKGDKCYFSSDRPNERCPQAKPACRDFDIYEGDLRATLKVFLFDQKNHSLLNDCNIELVDLATGEILTTYLHLKTNYASLGLEDGKNYQLIISRPGFYPHFESFSPASVELFQPIYKEIFLKKM